MKAEGAPARKGKRATRAEQGFESSPPLCRNCDWFANGGMRPAPKTGFAPHRCTLGSFNVQTFSVCDKWTNKGETIG